jgi:hypothetical protein
MRVSPWAMESTSPKQLRSQSAMVMVWRSRWALPLLPEFGSEALRLELGAGSQSRWAQLFESAALRSA